MAQQEHRQVVTNDTTSIPETAKVLVICGDDTDGYTSAEIYDPSTEHWTIVGGTFYPRSGGNAVLLQNGRVLIVGGNIPVGGIPVGGYNTLNAELYYPVTRTCYATGKPRNRRTSGLATLLADGKVLLVGGWIAGPGGFTYVMGAELYDPIVQVWSHTGDLNEGRGYGHTATLLQNGKVLVTGGNINTGAVVPSTPAEATAELYDPSTGAWTYTGGLFSQRKGHTATLLQHGKVLVTGGLLEGVGQLIHSLDSSELYDVNSGSWNATGRLQTPRFGHTATLLSDGRVLVVGGVTRDVEGVDVLSSAEIYDPVSQVWEPTASLGRPTIAHSATLLPDGRVLIAGGMSSEVAPPPVTSAELYDPSIGGWTSTGNLNFGRHSHSASLVSITHIKPPAHV